MAKLWSVDLFSGCGGFGLGASLAGFSTKLAIDIDPTLSSSYALNFPNVRHENWDLAAVTAEVLREAISEDAIDLVTGGPPCQGFSEIGRRQKEDPRNSLVAHYFRAVATIRPKVFVMENVPNILAPEYQNILAEGIALVQNQYTVLEPQTLMASDFGAATTRERTLIVGFDPARCPEIKAEDFVQSSATGVTVKDAILDLPRACVSAAETNQWGWAKYTAGTDEVISEYAQWARMLPPDGLGSVVAKEALIGGRVSGNYKTKHQQEVIKRFRSTDPGSVEKVSRYHRLNANAACPTLRAGTGPDRGSFQSARPIHPTAPRVITVREAARLQGFPDWFLFHPTKWHSFRMIGNSVCPLFARAILQTIKSNLVHCNAQGVEAA